MYRSVQQKHHLKQELGPCLYWLKIAHERVGSPVLPALAAVALTATLAGKCAPEPGMLLVDAQPINAVTEETRPTVLGEAQICAFDPNTIETQPGQEIIEHPPGTFCTASGVRVIFVEPDFTG